MHNKSTLGLIAYILVIIGALNWGLVGALDYNLVSAIFGASVITKIIYILIGVAAIYMIATKSSYCGMRKSGTHAAM